MMKHPVQTAVMVAVISLPRLSDAEEASSTSRVSPAAPPTHEATDWSQTHLSPDSALREQIEQTQAFLHDGASGMDGEVSHLKTEGVLDRRSSSKIRNALDHARGSMTRVTDGIESGQQIDGWTARMIAYELGMAADTLAHEAKPIEAELNAGSNGVDDATDDDSLEVERRRHLAKTLRESSNLLKETARAIVRNLK